MSFRHAWAFLTRLPGGAHPADERGLGMSVPWFPVVGAVIGLMIGMVWLGMNELVSPLTSATIAVMVGVMITGAFHEDGLADTADSLGGYTPEREAHDAIRDVCRSLRTARFSSRDLFGGERAKFEPSHLLASLR